jgi:AcrR family transcriptional regulator
MTRVYAKLYTMSSGDPETRKRILEKTWHLMEKRKGRGVKISDIARAAGISRQAVYLHFGSRAGLLIATARYIDEVKNLNARVQAMNMAANGVEVLDAYVDFWGNYIPEIYGAAKALLTMRETDKDAAAAWDDRMNEQRQGCRSVIDCLVRDQSLGPIWSPEEAADTLWAMTSIPVWENLTTECGWTSSEYISRMKAALKQMFVR